MGLTGFRRESTVAGACSIDPGVAVFREGFHGLGKNAEQAPKFALRFGGKRGTGVQARGMQKSRNCFPPTLWRTSGRGVFSTAAAFYLGVARHRLLVLFFGHKEKNIHSHFADPTPALPLKGRVRVGLIGFRRKDTVIGRLRPRSWSCQLGECLLWVKPKKEHSMASERVPYKSLQMALSLVAPRERAQREGANTRAETSIPKSLRMAHPLNELHVSPFRGPRPWPPLAGEGQGGVYRVSA